MYHARALLPIHDQIQMHLPFYFIFRLVYDAQFFYITIYKVKRFDA